MRLSTTERRKGPQLIQEGRTHNRRQTAALFLMVALVGGLVGMPALAPAPAKAAAPAQETTMKTGRANHTASLLAGDRVLVAGGNPGTGGVMQRATESAEVYSPAPGAWEAVASMAMPRTVHTATVMTGPECRKLGSRPDYCGAVLVTGGYTDGLPQADRQSTGSKATSTFTTELFRWDETSTPKGTWTRLPDMGATRAEHTATLLDPPGCQGGAPAVAPEYPCGKVLIVGGYGVDPSEIDPSKAASADVAETRARLNNQLPVKALELYDPNQLNTPPQRVGTLAVPRARHAATLLADGRVAIIGGRTWSAGLPQSTGSVEIYDPAKPQPLSRAADMLPCEQGTPPQQVTCQGDLRVSATPLPDGNVLMFSGRQGDASADRRAQIFIPPVAGGGDRGMWLPTSALKGDYNNTVDYHASVLLPRAGRVLVSGLETTPSATPATQIDRSYDIAGATWATSAPDTIGPRSLHGQTMTVLSDSTVLVAGGMRIDIFSGTQLKTVLNRAVRLDGRYVPGKPTGVAMSAAGSAVRISWGPPTYDGGTDILRYQVKAFLGSQLTDTKVFDGAGPGFVTGSGESWDPRTHSFEVRAINEKGEGPAGTPGALPAPLPPTQVEATPGNGSAFIRWQRPAEAVPPPDDGSAVIGYEVRETRRTDATRTVDGAAETATEFTGLQNGETYTFTVRAKSANSEFSPWSPPSAQVTPGLILTAPAITDVEARDRSALVLWSHPHQPVGRIDAYTVTAVPGGASIRVPYPATVAVVPGLTNGTAYRFSVRGVNSAGDGPASAPSAALTPTLSSVATPPPLADSATTTAPVVTDVAARGGPASGGPEVIVTGTGFATAQKVRFGDIPASEFSVISDQQISVSLPPNPSAGRAGRVTVVVTNNFGESAADAPGAWFHYGVGGWSTSGSIGQERPGSPVLRADGRALTVGSISVPSPAGPVSATLVFDPVAGLWSPQEWKPTAPAAGDPQANSVGRPLAVRMGGRLCSAQGPACAEILAFRSGPRAPLACAANPYRSYPDGASDVQTACLDPNVPQLYRTAEGWQDTTVKKATAANGAAAVLDDGRVLVAGGCCDTFAHAINAAEAFVPAGSGGAWSPVQPLPLPLKGHTLTVMAGDAVQCGANCGRVLAAGGIKDVVASAYLSNADLQQPFPAPAIFDPITNTWRITARMQVPRADHGAVALPGGKVMVVGGTMRGPTVLVPEPAGGKVCLGTGPSAGVCAGVPLVNTFQLSPPQPTATVEVFDPTTETWSFLAPMATRRAGAATLLLSDGRVLVAGGDSPDGPVAGAEIYDPKKNLWSSAGALRRPGAVQLVELPATGTCGANCGKILALRDDGSVETYTLPPIVTALSPSTGPAGTPVTISGARFMPGSRVFFGGVPATSVTVNSVGSISAVAPPAALVDSPVSVLTEGGMATEAVPFRYTGLPGGVGELGARVVSPRGVELSFSAAGTVADAAPAARHYVVKQSRTRITDANFAQATSLCGATCNFVPTKVGEQLRLAVGTLTPGTQYYYAVAALGAGDSYGPFSSTAVQTPTVLPGRVTDLSARVVSGTSVVLRFAAPGLYESSPPPVGAYVVKQSINPIVSDRDFDEALSLCDGLCHFEPGVVGEELSLTVGGLQPATSYYYALRAQGAADVLGAVSNAVGITTPGPCTPALPGLPNQITFQPGYSLMGLPGGTVTGSAALFGWFNLGSGNRYTVHDATHGVEAGQGYWGWFSCPTAVNLALGRDEVTMPLSKYHASIVGNPSTRPAEISGHDFAARWDPAMNNGAGGYRLSGFRQTTALEVGEGAWAFAYRDTNIFVRAR